MLELNRSSRSWTARTNRAITRPDHQANPLIQRTTPNHQKAQTPSTRKSRAQKPPSHRPKDSFWDVLDVLEGPIRLLELFDVALLDPSAPGGEGQEARNSTRNGTVRP